jgi:hypothetical protein
MEEVQDTDHLLLGTVGLQVGIVYVILGYFIEYNYMYNMREITYALKDF